MKIRDYDLNRMRHRGNASIDIDEFREAEAEQRTRSLDKTRVRGRELRILQSHSCTH